MLTEEDIDLLLDAIYHWENADADSYLLTSLLGITLSRSEEQARDVLANREKEYALAENERRMKREQAIVLKAKLLRLRDKIRIGQITPGDFYSHDE